MKLFTLPCLKKNDFYENACLGSGMTYGADLVVRVFLQFDYQFTLNQKQILDNASYEILGKLVIADKDNSTNYYEKDYVFQEKTSSTGGAHGQYYSVNKDIVIDYDEYNKVATHFKSKYGVDAEGYLIVYLKFYHDLDSLFIRFFRQGLFLFVFRCHKKLFRFVWIHLKLIKIKNVLL